MKTKIWRIVTLLVVVSMVMAACGPTPEPTTAPEPTAEPAAAEPTEAPAEEATKAPEAKPEGGPVDATPGETVNMVLLPKFLGILVFDQANDGARKPTPNSRTQANCSSWGPRRRTASPARSKSSPPPPPRARTPS